MKTIFLISQREVDIARSIEDKLLDLPSSSGILFVGVSISQTTDQPTYHVWVGCNRSYEESLMDSLVRVTLRDLEGIRLQVHAHRGCVRDKNS
jgi:hypothetical protein